MLPGCKQTYRPLAVTPDITIMAIQTMFPTTTVRPRSQYSLGTNIGGRTTGFGPFHGQVINVLRDTCSLPTWIFSGCLLQCLLSAALPWFVSIVPVLLYFSWNFLETTLTLRGLRKDPYLEGVIQGKFSVAYPAEGQKDVITGKPGVNGPGAVMILGSRCNHTLGMFAPGKCLVLISCASLRWLRVQRSWALLPPYGEGG